MRGAHRVHPRGTMRSPLAVVLALLAPSAIAAADDDVYVDANAEVAVDAAPAANVDVNVDVNVQVVQPPLVEPVVVVDTPALAPAHHARRRPSLHGDRWEAGVALAGGSFELGDIGGGQVAVRGSLGRQLGVLRIGVDGSVGTWSATRDTYDAMGWWSGWEDLSGEVKRVGATARLRGVYDPNDPTCPCELGAYVEGGAGKSWITTTGSNEVLERTDYVLGIGVEIAGGHHTMGGVDLGVRFIASPAIDPYDATHDVAIVGHLGALFGR